MWGEKKPIRKARGSKIAWTGGVKPAKKERKSTLVAVFKDPGMKDAIRNRALPAVYREPPVVSDELEAACALGSALVAKFDMQVSFERGVYPFPPLDRFYGSPGASIPVPKGSLLVYAGPVASTERKYVGGKAIDVRVYKHTFITPYGRCIIHDFNLIGLA